MYACIYVCSNKILLPNFSQFWLEKKKPLSILVRKGKFLLALSELPLQSITLHFCMKCVVAWYNISAKSKMCPDIEYQQEKRHHEYTN